MQNGSMRRSGYSQVGGNIRIAANSGGKRTDNSSKRTRKDRRGALGYLLRASPLLRLACVLLTAAAVFIALSFPSWHFHKRPQIDSLTPQVGMPGDKVTIRGSNFGSERTCGTDDSDVEFGGYPLTQSAYVKWTDNEIVVTLPMNVTDGIVLVRTHAGASNLAFFSNAKDIPQPVAAVSDAIPPVITSFSSSALAIGDLLTINGSGFGLAGVAGGAPPRVLFESAGKRIPASAAMGDMESWNDNEIKVRVADGATSGAVTIETASGTSDAKTLTVRNAAGARYFGGTRTYLVQLAADVNGLGTSSPSHIRLYFPRPAVSATQVSADMTECTPDVADEDYQGTSLRTLKVEAENAAKMTKSRYQENYAITVRSVRVVVNNPAAVTARSSMNARLYDAATRADACVPAADARIADLSRSMVSGEAGTYAMARAIYNKMTNRFQVTATRADVCEPLAMLDSGKGDAYDYAMVYTALLRAAGVPAMPCSGILVDKERQSKLHWWTIFYVSGVGWVPVDAALGAAAKVVDRATYFGALDNQHITFSIGYLAVKSALSRANIVQRQKSYALQSIWEESTKETRRYSSFWADPAVLGVY